MGPYKPLDEATREAMAAAAPAVLDRYVRHGRADRRESAVMTLLAGLAPLAGFLGFGWPPGTAVALALLNLGALLVDDLVKAALSRGSFRRMHAEAVEDELVWLVAEALMRGWPGIPLGTGPGRPGSVMTFGVVVGLAVLPLAALAAALAQTFGEGAAVPWQPLAWGSLPTLVLLVGSYAVGALAHNPHWHRSGAARLTSASLGITAIVPIGVGSWVAAEAIDASDGGLAVASYAVLSCAAVAALGAWRLHRLAQLDAIARWLGWRPRGRRRLA